VALTIERPVSVVFVSSPPVGLPANTGPVYLIKDTIPLPGYLLLRSRACLRRLYGVQRLSARQIGIRLGVSHSTVLAALASAGLNGHNGFGNANGYRAVRGQVPFGFVSVDNRLVKSDEEQKVIRLVRQLRRTMTGWQRSTGAGASIPRATVDR
jgi:hypothetical protein